MRRRLVVLALAVATAGPALYGSDSHPVAHVLKGRLTPAAWAGMFVKINGPGRRVSINQHLPEVRLYDAAGRQLLSFTGYGGQGREWLAKEFAGPAPANAAQLSQFLETVRTPEGKSIDLPRNEPVAVVMGAVWCMPCRALKADLEQISGITLLDIDVDRQNMSWQAIMKAVKASAP